MDNSSRKTWRSVWFWVAVVAVVAVARLPDSPTFQGWVEDVAGWARASCARIP